MIVSRLVTRALKLAGILGTGAAATADQMDDGVDTLNDMLEAWKIDDMDLGQPTLTAGATFYIDDAFLKGIRYSLAAEIAEETYGEVPGNVARIAFDEQRRIRAAMWEIDNLRVDDALLSRERGINFNNG
jgi:hypothetical protein